MQTRLGRLGLRVLDVELECNCQAMTFLFTMFTNLFKSKENVQKQTVISTIFVYEIIVLTFSFDI